MCFMYFIDSTRINSSKAMKIKRMHSFLPEATGRFDSECFDNLHLWGTGGHCHRQSVDTFEK